jgi:hypothetical protein
MQTFLSLGPIRTPLHFLHPSADQWCHSYPWHDVETKGKVKKARQGHPRCCVVHFVLLGQAVGPGRKDAPVPAASIRTACPDPNPTEFRKWRSAAWIPVVKVSRLPRRAWIFLCIFLFRCIDIPLCIRNYAVSQSILSYGFYPDQYLHEAWGESAQQCQHYLHLEDLRRHQIFDLKMNNQPPAKTISDTKHKSSRHKRALYVHKPSPAAP